MSRAKECAGMGCTRKTLRVYCWQHKDMAKPVTLDSHIALLMYLRRVMGGDIEVVSGDHTFDPINTPKTIEVVDTGCGVKIAARFSGDNRRRVIHIK